MIPLYNSFPQLSNQVQQTTPPTSQQVVPPNPSLANPCNMMQNPMHIQPQLGTNNPQIKTPFSNSNTQMNTPNMPTSITPPGFMNAPTHLLPFQNTHMGLTHLGSQPGHSHLGFAPQNTVCNMNSVVGFPVNGQFCNMMQNANQVNVSQPPFVHNFQNLPQQLNQNMGFSNGQFCLPNMMQNMNQFVPLQMPNPSQYGVPLCSRYTPPQATVPQNPAFFPYPQFGHVHCNQVGKQVNQNQQNLVQPTVHANVLPVAAQQLQGNSSAPLNHCSVQPQQTKILQPSVSTWSQGNPNNNGGINIPNSNWNNSPRKNFTRNQKRGISQGGYQKSQFHEMKNAKRKFGIPNEYKGKGFSNERAGNIVLANSTNQAGEQKRSLSLTYTEKEIHQWRESRRKNYPSKVNVEKKLTEKLTDSDSIDREAKLRREQLKDILAKQAELGVEVAEVPSYYLLDSEKQGNGREEKSGQLTKKGRFQNKFDKRGRYDRKDWFAKKQRLADKDSSNHPSLNKREPTLLQKLLSADIKTDKSHLLQVFRFMVMNSFFKDWPDKPLKFPSVMVKESGCAVEEKSSPVMVKKLNDEDGDKNDDDEDNDNEDVEKDAHGKEVSCFVMREGSIGEGIERAEEEEGEIID